MTLDTEAVLANTRAPMKLRFLKRLGKSALRIIAALAGIFGVAALCYLLWFPGSKAVLPPSSRHAIWLGHGWLGDDSWFVRNNRDVADFRDEAKCAALFQKLHDNGIAMVYPHLCPAQFDGKIAPYDDAQVERFLDLAEQWNIQVIPWIGGVYADSAYPGLARWRENFVASVAALLETHPRLAGVQVNIEPMPNGDADFLVLLEELRVVICGKILGIAAYPPPTRWHQFPDVHWDAQYLRQVASRCDQMAVMMYDTAIPLEKFYIALMTRWTRELSENLQSLDCELILGVPAYEDAGVGYHRPQVENLSSALRGISAAARQKSEFDGVAIYCEWEMDDAKWQEWRKFLPSSKNAASSRKR